MKPFCDEENDALKSYEKAFITRYTYNSNTIEGSTLSIGDTALVLEGEFIPGKPGREHFMARGVAEGFDYARRMLEEGRPFTENLIKDIHERTALDCQPRTRGTYRTNPVYLIGSSVEPVHALEIRENMADLFYAYENSNSHPVIKAAAFHAMFENIHPFVDGNGRCGRTILNYMLEKEGYLSVSLKADNRKGYIDGLTAWQLEGNPMPFLALIIESLDIEYASRTDAVEQTRETMRYFREHPALEQESRDARDASRDDTERRSHDKEER